MSDDPRSRNRNREGGGSGRLLVIPVLVLAAGIWILALAEVGQTWETMRLAGRYDPPARVGDLVSTTLLNGQVFFGTLDSVTRNTISLRDVFFAQPAPRGQEQDTVNQRPTILRRSDNEWTQATAMAIPVDRVAYMENIGPDSRIARIITDARGRPPAKSGSGPASPAAPSGSPKG
jgi:hypothetical protein